MIRLFIFIVFIQILSAQYNMGHGLWFGTDGHYMYTALFQDIDVGKNDPLTDTYRGNGYGFSGFLQYRFNNMHSLMIESSLKTFNVEHNSKLIYGTFSTEKPDANKLDSNITQSVEYYVHRFQYVRRFYPLHLFSGFGIEFSHQKDNPQKSADGKPNTYVASMRPNLRGVITFGFDYRGEYIAFMPYLGYSFNVTPFRKEENSNVSLHEIKVGLKVSYKLF